MSQIPPQTAEAAEPADPADQLTLDVVDLMATLVSAFHKEYEVAAGARSLTGAQAKVLALLRRGPLPMRRIAHTMSCEPSNVTGIVDRLEARGLVERRPDPDDRRVKLVAATEAGAAAAADLRESLSFAREPLAALDPEERVQLRGLLRRMADRANAANPAAPANSASRAS